MRLLGDAFSRTDPAIKIEIVTGLGTLGGIRALAAGAVDLAVAARSATAEERGVGLRSTLYAATPLASATHPGTESRPSAWRSWSPSSAARRRRGRGVSQSAWSGTPPATPTQGPWQGCRRR